nr:hypothetical protein [uncultured Sphingomonas sp.]
MIPDPQADLWDFRFDPPPDFVWREELMPIDSYGKVWRGSAIPEFGVSLDGYASRLRCTAAPCREWQEPFSGGTATFVRDAWVREGEGIEGTLNVYFPVISRYGEVTLALTIIASCASKAACDRVEEIARTIRVVRRRSVTSR